MPCPLHHINPLGWKHAACRDDGGAGDDIVDLEGHSSILLASATGVSSNTAPSVASTADSTLSIALDDGSTLNMQAALYGMDAEIQFANGDTLDLETWVSENLVQSVSLNLNNIQLTSGALVTKAYGGAGADRIWGRDNGNSTLKGYGGNDQLVGAGGNDTLYGGTGNDRLFGRAGNDVLDGEDGNDELQGDDGGDVLRGGGDADTIRTAPWLFYKQNNLRNHRLARAYN